MTTLPPSSWPARMRSEGKLTSIETKREGPFPPTSHVQGDSAAPIGPSSAWEPPPSRGDSPGPKRGSEGETLSQLNPITQSVGWLYLPNPRHKEKMTDSWDLGFQDESILSLDRGGAETQLHGRSVGSEARGARPSRKKRTKRKEQKEIRATP